MDKKSDFPPIFTRNRPNSRKYWLGLASCKVGWSSKHFNLHRLNCSVYHASFYEASLLLAFSTVTSSLMISSYCLLCPIFSSYQGSLIYLLFGCTYSESRRNSFMLLESNSGQTLIKHKSLTPKSLSNWNKSRKFNLIFFTSFWSLPLDGNRFPIDYVYFVLVHNQVLKFWS